MEEKYSRRDFLEKNGRRLLGLITGSSLLSSIGCIGKTLFDEEIDGQRIVYFNNPNSLMGSDYMEIYDKEGKLIAELVDGDGNGIIGDSKIDYYLVHLDKDKKVKYSKNYVINEEGVVFRKSDRDPISKIALEIGKQKLEEATELYQSLKGKIMKELESQLK